MRRPACVASSPLAWSGRSSSTGFHICSRPVSGGRPDPGAGLRRPIALRRIRRAVRRGVLRTRIVRRERRRSRLVLVTGRPTRSGALLAGRRRAGGRTRTPVPSTARCPPTRASCRTRPRSSTSLAERPDKVTVGNSGHELGLLAPHLLLAARRPGVHTSLLRVELGPLRDRGDACPGARQGAPGAGRGCAHDHRRTASPDGSTTSTRCARSPPAAARSSSAGAGARASTGPAPAPAPRRPASATWPGSSARRSSRPARYGTRSSW